MPSLVGAPIAILAGDGEDAGEAAAAPKVEPAAKAEPKPEPEVAKAAPEKAPWAALEEPAPAGGWVTRDDA